MMDDVIKSSLLRIRNLSANVQGDMASAETKEAALVAIHAEASALLDQLNQSSVNRFTRLQNDFDNLEKKVEDFRNKNRIDW